MLKEKKIVIIGAGTMGKALVKGLLNSENINGIVAVEKNEKFLEKAKKELSIPVYPVSQAKDYIKAADIIVICVKPQDVNNCVEGFKKYLRDDTLIISIAAGISNSYIEEIIQSQNPVIRAMPNTPCIIGEGMVVVSRGINATEKDIALSLELFSSLGKCIELEEKHMNAVTGLSGSGPAFIYLIIEALSDGGVMEGLPRNVSTMLVAQTMLGSAKMVLEGDKHPAELKDQVTTPAGCTIGAILSLEDGRIRSVLARGVQEASKIASNLGK